MVTITTSVNKIAYIYSISVEENGELLASRNFNNKQDWMEEIENFKNEYSDKGVNVIEEGSAIQKVDTVTEERTEDNTTEQFESTPEVFAATNKLVNKYGLKIVFEPIGLGGIVGLVRKTDKNQNWVQMNELEVKQGNFSPILAQEYKAGDMYDATINFYKWIKELNTNKEIATL